MFLLNVFYHRMPRERQRQWSSDLVLWQLEGAVPSTEASALFDFGPEDVKASFRYGRERLPEEPIQPQHNPRIMHRPPRCLSCSQHHASQAMRF